MVATKGVFCPVLKKGTAMTRKDHRCEGVGGVRKQLGVRDEEGAGLFQVSVCSADRAGLKLSFPLETWKVMGRVRRPSPQETGEAAESG